MPKFAYILIFVLLLISGCSSGNKLSDAELERRSITRKIQLVEATGGFVLMVGGETLTSEDVIETPAELGEKFVLPVEQFKPIAQAYELEQFKQRVRNQLRNILISKISNMLLYQEAKREVGDNLEVALEKQAEKAMREFVMAYGGDQIKADEALKENGLDWKSFKERQKRTMLIQWYISKKTPDDRPIAYGELIDCYHQMKDEFFAIPAIIQFRLIDIQPDKLTLWKMDERLKLAKLLANRLLTRIRSGEDFGELAKQYSHGPMREFGGLWKPMRPDSLVAPYDLISAEARKIEPGQVSDLIVSEEHIFIMKLEEKQLGGYEPFEKVQEQVRNKIRIDRQNKVFEKVNAELLQQAELSNTDEFVDFCLDKIYQMKDRTVMVKRSIYQGAETQKPKDSASPLPGAGAGLPRGIGRK
ncbi:MAG: peptidylprolyl isomerase [Sedimentisphaerales bacterium]|nr:peptidylprolyl isomerase [Sedimentisphaerales bacterium]